MKKILIYDRSDKNRREMRTGQKFKMFEDAYYLGDNSRDMLEADVAAIINEDSETITVIKSRDRSSYSSVSISEFWKMIIADRI